MNQFSIFQPLSWTVSELTRYVRELLEGDEYLQELWVQGEVSNFSRPSSGHIYFTLKDASASLRCVMWRNAAMRLQFLPRDGDAVRVHGNISVYEAGGQYQLYADIIRPVGEGDLYKEFLRLKARLEAEGLFDPERKRPVPRYPQCIGIITSPTGAALQDMLNTLNRRYPLARIVLAPVPVQGIEAPGAIIAALEALNRIACPDVILLARGGGSIEDLWAFNDENLARTIVNSTAPVITGVGHETDFTIADFACDLRAPTPTGAAMLATPDRADLLMALSELQLQLERSGQSAIRSSRWSLDNLAARLKLRSPAWRLMSNQQRLDEVSRRLKMALEHDHALRMEKLTGLNQRLVSLAPLSILSRGYAILTHLDGRTVKSTRQVAAGDLLKVRVSDGTFDVRVDDSDRS